MKTITIKKLNTGELFPLFCKYDGQFYPQTCYITLDVLTGELTADYNSNIGGGIPEDQFNGLIQTWVLDPVTTESKINEILEENEEYFQNILNRFELKNIGLKNSPCYQNEFTEFAGFGAMTVNIAFDVVENIDYIPTIDRDVDNIIFEIKNYIDDLAPDMYSDPDLDIQGELENYYVELINNESDQVNPIMTDWVMER